jgi:hypothetical protein
MCHKYLNTSEEPFNPSVPSLLALPLLTAELLALQRRFYQTHAYLKRVYSCSVKKHMLVSKWRVQMRLTYPDRTLGNARCPELESKEKWKITCEVKTVKPLRARRSLMSMMLQNIFITYMN